MSTVHFARSRNVAACALLGLTAMLTVFEVAGATTSARLTRKKAEQLIRSKYTFPSNEQRLMFQLSWDNYCFQVKIDPCPDGLDDPPCCGPDALNAPKNAGISALHSLGLITITFSGNTSRMALTAQGQKYAVGMPREYSGESGGKFSKVVEIGVVASTLEFGTITGIMEGEGSNSAEVEYTVIRKPTPFGKYLTGNNNGAETARMLAPAWLARTATFRKYDDGWRITK